MTKKTFQKVPAVRLVEVDLKPAKKFKIVKLKFYSQSAFHIKRLKIVLPSASVVLRFRV